MRGEEWELITWERGDEGSKRLKRGACEVGRVVEGKGEGLEEMWGRRWELKRVEKGEVGGGDWMYW